MGVIFLNPYAYATPGPGAIAPDEVTTATMYAWHEADLITPQTDDTQFGTWSDNGGAGRSLLQPTGTLQPFYRTSGPNGLPYVEFKGAEVLSGNTNLGTRTQPQTVFAVVRWDTAQASILHGGSSSNHVAIAYEAVLGVVSMFAGGWGPAWSPALPTAWVLLTCFFNGASCYMRVNGVPATDGDSDAGLAVGTRIDMGALNRFGAAGFDGGVAARIMYEGTLSDAERDGLEAHLTTKYAL